MTKLTKAQRAVLVSANGRSIHDVAQHLTMPVASVSAVRTRLRNLGLIREWANWHDPMELTEAGRSALTSPQEPAP